MNFDLGNLERYWIKYFDSMNPLKGYNLTEGGEGISGFKHQESTKQKIALKATGREKSLEERAHISKRTQGDKNPFYGKTHTEEFMTTKRKKVRGVNLNTNEESIFNSVKDAADFIKGQIGHVSSVCSGKRKSHKGFKFYFLSEAA